MQVDVEHRVAQAVGEPDGLRGEVVVVAGEHGESGRRQPSAVQLSVAPCSKYVSFVPTAERMRRAIRSMT